MSFAWGLRLMRIAIVPNAFKGSLTASEAAGCIERGIRKAMPTCSVIKVPVADGGDGTARAVVAATGGTWVNCAVRDPLGRALQSGFGLTGDGRTAVIEMALASGLALLKPAEQNPLLTSTCGTGDLICAALDRGVQKILIGIGGSATHDGGMGMARALGVQFLDERGRELDGTGASLAKLSRIDARNLDPRLTSVAVDVACDVDNPLSGPRGAARVYSPQKGATPEMVEQLDVGLRRFAAVVQHDLGIDVSSLPGGGAAGGLGAGLVAFLNGRLRPGAELVIGVSGLDEKLAGCDLVITGEGRLDGQTVFGKAPAGVAKVARARGVPVIAICGCLGPGVEKVHDVGIEAYFSALEEAVAEAELPERAPGMLERCAEQVGRLLAMGQADRKERCP
jgi:glycerate kinase